MTADASDDPQALTPAPFESVSPAVAAPKPYRSSAGAKGRQTSRNAAKQSSGEGRGPMLSDAVLPDAVPPHTVLRDPVASEPVIVAREPVIAEAVEPAGAASASAEPEPTEPLPAPPVMEVVAESLAESPVPESLADSPVPESLAENPVPESQAETAAPDSQDVAAGTLSPDSPAPASSAPAEPVWAEPPLAEPVSDPIPAVAAAVAPVPAVVPEAPTVTPGTKPKPTYHNKNLEIAMTTTKELLTHGQANVEAVIKSGQIWASGVQDITRTMAESAQAQFDHTVGTWKALSGTKSLKEAFDIQSSRTRAALEKAVADGSKLTDASLKLAEQALAPITARITVASESLAKTA